MQANSPKRKIVQSYTPQMGSEAPAYSCSIYLGFLLFVSVLFVSCKEEVVLPPKGGNYSAGINILFTNSKGTNILTESIAANFKLFYIVDEKEKEVLYCFHDNPRSIWSVEANGQKSCGSPGY